MNFKNINDIKVSSVVLGSDSFGTIIDEKTAFSLMDKFCYLGGNTIDTARVYGAHFGGKTGDSEIVIGKWLAQRGKRDDVVISTKCAHPNLATMNISRLSKKEIEDDVDKSLQALGTDYIDILWLHRDDINVAVDGIVDALDELVKKGKIRCFGTSNWRANRIDEAVKYSKLAGKNAFCASQIKWAAAKSSPSYKDDPTLVEMNKSEYEYYAKTKMPVFAFASQAKGFFQKYHTGGEQALSYKAKERYLCDENIERYKKLIGICEKYGISLSSAIVSSIISNTDFDTVAIIGPKNVDQLCDSMQGVQAMLDYNEVRTILDV